MAFRKLFTMRTVVTRAIVFAIILLSIIAYKGNFNYTVVGLKRHYL